jgi:hypothetical protein
VKSETPIPPEKVKFWTPPAPEKVRSEPDKCLESLVNAIDKVVNTRLWPFDDRATPTDDFRHYPCGEFLEVGKWTKSSYEDIKTAAYFGARLFTFGCNTLFEVTDKPPDGLRFCYKHHHG